MPQRNSKYKLFSAIYNSASVEGLEVDLTANIIETHMYEHLEKPYITGRIVVLDDFGMRNYLKIKGSERINLEFRSGDDDDTESVVKNFFISKVLDVKRTSDRAEVLSIELVEDHFWVNSVKSISKSYKGKLENIINEIITDQFAPRKCRQENFTGTAQGERKLVVPYMNPLSAVQWIKSRATTTIGSPIYVYATLFQDDIIISDLDGLLLKERVNPEPYLHSLSLQTFNIFEEIKRPYREILNYREGVSENSLGLYENGGIGSFYSMTDAGTGLSDESHLSVLTVLDDLNYNNVLKKRNKQNIFDEKVVIDDKFSDEYNSVHTFQITSGKTYAQYANFHDETDETFSRLKNRNRVIRLALKKDNLEIMVDGSPWFESAVSVGAKIRILFLNTDPSNDTKSLAEQYDYKKSGDFLVLAAHHSLIEERHRVTAQLTKIEDLSQDEIDEE